MSEDQHRHSERSGDSGPGAEAVSHTAPRTRTLPQLGLRALAGIPALAALLVLVVYAPLPVLAAVALAAGTFGYWEYLRLLQDSDGPAAPHGLLVAAAAVVGLGGFAGTTLGLAAALFGATCLVTVTLLLRAAADPTGALRGAGAALLGLLWVPWSLGHLALLVHLPQGRALLLLLVAAVVLNDTLAYLVGSLLGRHRLAPGLSPKKTIEGALGGLAAGAGAGLLAWVWQERLGLDLRAWEWLPLGVALAALGQVGDLLESSLKRVAGAVDSGRFLPGHGGLLDRVDCFLVAGPSLYYYFTLFPR